MKTFFPSIAAWWDRGKVEIRGLAVLHCCRLAKERKQRKTLLSTLASHMKVQIDNGAAHLFGMNLCLLNWLRLTKLLRRGPGSFRVFSGPRRGNHPLNCFCGPKLSGVLILGLRRCDCLMPGRSRVRMPFWTRGVTFTLLSFLPVLLIRRFSLVC